MEKEIKKEGIFYIAVTDKEDSENRAYSNFVLQLCKSSIRQRNIQSINIDDFEMHNQIQQGNIKVSLFECLIKYKHFVVLLDDCQNNYNPNVWFELGVVSTKMDSSIVVIADENTANIPFDVNDVFIVRIPSCLKEHYKKLYNNATNKNSIDWYSIAYALSSNDSQESDTLRAAYNHFSYAFSNQFEKMISPTSNPFNFLYDSATLQRLGMNNLYELLVSSRLLDLLEANGESARYISGEQEAFEELEREVSKAKYSLRTTRFANQSIVARGTKLFHKNFMKALYEASYRVERCDRIICNNNSIKWNDIFSVLKNSSNKMCVYVRKEEHNINFELVIVDETVAFIHFYQTNCSGDLDEDAAYNRHDSHNQHIKSTLKLTGVNVCRELARIFDRLHHRDSENRNPQDLSRTLIGVNSKTRLTDEEKTHGFFTLSGHDFGDTDEDQIQKENLIKTKMTDALKNWQLSEKDKVIMAIGLCLIFSMPLNMLNIEFNQSEKKEFNKMLNIFDPEENIMRFILENEE
jgi:hypothetical protein